MSKVDYPPEEIIDDYEEEEVDYEKLIKNEIYFFIGPDCFSFRNLNQI